MALFRIPSKKIQYGYVEVEVSFTDDMTVAEIARTYMRHVSEFQMAEIDYVEGKLKPEPESFPEADEPSEELTEEEAIDAVVDGLGATEVPDTKAPWEKPATKAAEPKPWDELPTFDWS